MRLLLITGKAFIGFFLLLFVSCGGGKVDPNQPVRPQSSASDVGSAREKQMAALVRGHPRQKREALVWDARLAAVARERARSMGTRGYFGHVDPDGFGPNWYVTRAGYRLPLQWTAFDGANQVESILAGHATAEAAFQKWMGSKQHSAHLLALNPFYQNQTRFGVACVTVPGSVYRDYWVFLSAPPER
jgi:uncharacterized protein YkwD